MTGGPHWLFSFPMSKGEFGTQVKQELAVSAGDVSSEGEFKGGSFNAIYHPWRCDQMAWWEWNSRVMSQSRMQKWTRY